MDLALERSLADRFADFAVLHIDLDLFKQVNDSFGHAAGDHVLSRVGDVLRSELRHTDVAGRVGGDEFLVIVYDCTDPAALGALAERLIAELEEPIVFEGEICRISASIGIAASTDYVARPSADDLLADTDMALYRAKRGGRGRYMAHADPAAGLMPDGRRASDRARPDPDGDRAGDPVAELHPGGAGGSAHPVA
jgi:diguanylate cyclase (GGDEF)-like protein